MPSVSHIPRVNQDSATMNKHFINACIHKPQESTTNVTLLAQPQVPTAIFTHQLMAQLDFNTCRVEVVSLSQQHLHQVEAVVAVEDGVIVDALDLVSVITNQIMKDLLTHQQNAKWVPKVSVSGIPELVDQVEGEEHIYLEHDPSVVRHVGMWEIVNNRLLVDQLPV